MLNIASNNNFNTQLGRNKMMTVAYFDLLLVYMRILILISTIPENQMIFVLYSAAVQVRADQTTVSTHLNKYVLCTF